MRTEMLCTTVGLMGLALLLGILPCASAEPPVIELKPIESADKKKLKAVVDAEKCFGCGVCVIGCKEAHAITMECVRPAEHIPTAT